MFLKIKHMVSVHYVRLELGPSKPDQSHGLDSDLFFPHNVNLLKRFNKITMNMCKT